MVTHLSRFALTTLVLVAWASTALADGKDAGTSKQDADAWWFPSEIPPGTTLYYHLAYELATTYEDGDTWRTQREISLTLDVCEEPGEPGCVLRIPVDKKTAEAQDENLASLIVKYLRSINTDGVRVTNAEVLVRGEPLFRGPWRKGDRLMLAGAIYVMLAPASLVCHADVASADRGHAHLECDLWGGIPLPLWQGEADVRIESDDLGVTSLSMSWKQVFERQRREGKVTVTRTQVVPARPTASTPDEAP